MEYKVFLKFGQTIVFERRETSRSNSSVSKGQNLNQHNLDTS